MRLAPAFVALALVASLAARPAHAQGMEHMHAHTASDTTPVAAAPRDPALPADETQARDALEHSPRHGEMVDVSGPGGVPLRTWIVYPERRDAAGVVMIVHEIFGLSDWIRALADQYAAAGFIAVAPDLLSGLGPNGGGTAAFGSRDSVVQAIRQLTPDMTMARLDAVRAWARTLPAANGRVATAGYCWGGGNSFAYAAHPGDLAAAVVYYGTSPDSTTLAALHAPVLGLYGGDDARVDATVPPAQRVTKALGKRYEPHLYDGAGHGFLRQQTGRDGANLKATRDAWPRTIAFLKQHLEGKKR